MIQKLNHTSSNVAKKILEIQIPAYKVEAKYIKTDAIPRLYDTVADIQNCDETFYGYWIQDDLAGFISFVHQDNMTDIHRLVVSPNYFHQGIASLLLQHIFQLHPASNCIVQTGKKNIPAISLYKKHGFTQKQEFHVHNELVLIQLEKTKK
ncbi:acetyltransferase [Bacillus manliponensis]|uniref:Acetyltransferase n=1 Tax=Bacillus manliponensis TaxID=574376 RepID=A0A073JSX6_9BACI|nr:GNAT family N-acetyltransferase [Bacillus manliponensis]KEK17405.1 acetyltransferase [Bacillus manliponensis]